MKKIKNKILIGCSGYYYPNWKNSFYPAGLPASKWLQHYSTVFNTVELNSPFYRLPKLTDMKKQIANTPEDFKFSVKVNRYITHTLKLKDVASHVNDFRDLITEGYGDKLHKFLFQLPPSFNFTEERIDLINNIDWGTNSAIEFRHQSWWCKKTELTLKKNKCTFCNVDFPGLDTPFMDSSKDFYLRLHGTPELFKSSYTEEQLIQFHSMIPKKTGTYSVYFNNTYYDAGYKNALVMQNIFND